MMPIKENLPAEPFAAAEAFQFKGTLFSIEPYGNGRIHQTFKVVSQKDTIRRQWILQKLNQEVLPDLEAVTNNIVAITRHLSQKREPLSTSHPLLTPIPTHNGYYLFQNFEGFFWRAFGWIDGVAYEKTDRPEIAYAAACAVGRFHADLTDYKGLPLATTIVDFHHTAKRVEQLHAAVAADQCRRVGNAATELALIEANLHLAETIPIDKVPRRIVHNDPKLNNILFDAHTQKALCLIDFDTVMPGTVLHDFGDLVRSLTNSGGEGTRPEAVIFNDKIYGPIEDGYLSVMGDSLTPLEKKLLPQAGSVLAFELGIRFLTDYLDGDGYFPITHPDDNLNRCRVQLALLDAMQKKIST